MLTQSRFEERKKAGAMFSYSKSEKPIGHLMKMLRRDVYLNLELRREVQAGNVTSLVKSTV